MPRKAKEKTDVELNSTKVVKDADVKNIVTSTAKKKSSSTVSKKTTSSKKNGANSKNTTISKKRETKKKESATKTTKSRKATSKNPSALVEYYDLPFRYNETVVKILAQTPTTLFIYWDISDTDRNMYIEKYGKEFFNNSRPILIINNETMGYKFEVEINDFANSWYLHVNDANCQYKIELGRKLIENNYAEEYIPIISSNEIEAPNNHILFSELGDYVFFKDIKTNITEKKNILTLSHIQSMGKIYNIYDIYQKMYNTTGFKDGNLNMDFPSSNSSSTFK